MVDYDAKPLICALPAEPAQVWTALTDPSALSEWFGATTLVPRAGLPVDIRPPAGSTLPAGTGEVAAIEPPRRLVLRWRAGGRVLGLTLLVDPGPDATLLRVAFSNTGGIDQHQLHAVAELFERLRAYLAGEPVPDPTPGPTPGPMPAPMPAPMVAPMRGPTTDATPPSGLPAYPAAESAASPVRRKGRVVVPIAAGVVVIAVLLAVFFTVTGAPVTWGSPGSSRTGSNAAAAEPAATPSGSSSSAGPSSSAGSSSSTTTTPSASATSGAAGPLAASSVVTNRAANSLTVAVTLTNPTASGQTWRNVAVALTSTNLSLSNVDPRVNFSWAASVACFTPGPSVTTVAANGTLTFSFTVTGSGLSDLGPTSLNQTSCV